MKSNLLLITMVFMTIQLRAQYYCPFTYYVTPGTTDVAFYPNSYYPAGQYHFEWMFGDGGTSTLVNPTHTFTAPVPYFVQCYVYDAVNNPVCGAADSIYLSAPYSCGISVMGPISVDSFAFSTQPLSGAHIEWDFGDGTGIIPGNPVMHSYTQIGNYNCTCYHKDSAQNIMCQHTELMTVHSTHGCYFTTSPNGSNPSIIDFLAWPLPGYTVDWDFGDTTTGTGIQTQHSYSSAGIYNVCFVAYDTLGDSCNSCMTVQVGSSNPFCFFTATPDPNNPLRITFDDTTAMNGNVVWHYGDQSGDSGFAATVTYTYATTGTYYVCMDELDSNANISCQRCDSIFVGSVNCNFTSTPSISDPMTIDFSVNAHGYLASWTFGDGFSGTGANISHTYTGNGTYQVCVYESDTLTGSTVCTSCSWVQVNAPPSTCQASFFATSQSLTAYFIDISIPDSTVITNYAWDFGDGATSNMRFPQHVYQTPGTYNACLIINTFSCADTFCNSIAVDTNTIINPICNAFYAIVQIAPYQVTVVNLSSGNSLSYNWDFGDGSSDTLEYPSHFYSSTGSYNLCLTVDDGSGCSNTFCDTLTVDSLGNVSHIQQGFTLVVTSPSQLTLAVHQINSSAQFNVYPNPFESELFLVSTSDSKMESYRILSMQGSVIASGKIEGSDGKIGMQKFSSGTYLLEVRMKDGARFYRVIIRK